MKRICPAFHFGGSDGRMMLIRGPILLKQWQHYDPPPPSAFPPRRPPSPAPNPNVHTSRNAKSIPFGGSGQGERGRKSGRLTTVTQGDKYGPTEGVGGRPGNATQDWACTYRSFLVTLTGGAAGLKVMSHNRPFLLAVVTTDDDSPKTSDVS